MPDDTGQWNWKELFCLFCWPPCPRAIAAKLAFMPPVKTYNIKEDVRKVQTIWPNTESPSLTTIPNYHQHPERFDLIVARTSRCNKIVCVYVKNRENPTFTILFSHGNAVDIGQILDFYRDLTSAMRCNVLLYDYSGFGESTGKPSERNINADITTAWNVLRYKYEIPADKIVLYGQSIGTVPTVDLASRQQCAGVILQSPFTSGLRLVFPNWKIARPFDVFNNIGKVHRIKSRVLVIHGTDDSIIDISHGRELHNRCRNKVDPLWISGAGHNNIEIYPQFIQRLDRFLNKELIK
ncbi:hypothetical protein R5R35_001782 [Gryllus longicercus]